MDTERVRALLAAERRPLERMLARRTDQDDREDSDSFFDAANLAAELTQEELDEGLAEDLRAQLAAVERAEQRLAAGNYGRSIQSCRPIPHERLEALPTAELTVEEERAALQGTATPPSRGVPRRS
jgi:DnaK suppressor protein